MQTKNIISVAAMVASFAGVAFAGTSAKIAAPTPVPAPAPIASPLSGNVHVGYATNYTCRGLVASHALVEGDSVIPVGVDLNYKLNEANSIVASASYTSLTSGHELMGMEGENFHNETDFKLGWQNKGGLVDNLSTTVGWNLIHGGLLGYDARMDWSHNKWQKHAHSVAQEFYLNLNYDVNQNWFAGITTSYGFQGSTGWWFQPYVGYKTALCPATDLVITAGMSATASYFNNTAFWGDEYGQANGAQAWWLKAELPVKVGGDNLSLIPFVSFNWAGCGALKVNKSLDKGYKPYKNFGVVAGANLVYSF